MKKKKTFVALVAILSLICGNFTKISAYADYDSAISRGNFKLSGEELLLCTVDMDSLHMEVHDLYGELPPVIEIDASAAGKARRDDIRSKGVVNYGNGTVVLDSSDFIRLANEIDDLESKYKAKVVDALNSIGTFFKSNGSVTHDEQDKETVLPQFAAGLSFGAIYQGIKQSQSVDHLEASPAAENNISAGAAAWVNGQCIVGNGKDVQEAHDRGYDEGYDKGKADGYQDGYDKGKDGGYQDGYDKGKKDGYDEGYEQGDSDGYKRGYADGKADAAPADADIEYTYHEHTDACYEEQEVDCYIVVSYGEYFYQWCAGCGKEDPEHKRTFKWQRYTEHHTLCDEPGAEKAFCTEHVSPVPTSASHKIMSTVCTCGKTEETIESVKIIYHN